MVLELQAGVGTFGAPPPVTIVAGLDDTDEIGILPFCGNVPKIEEEF
jgi:hypothetical protein